MNRKRAQVTDENALATLGAGGILDRLGEELVDVSPVEVQEVPVGLIKPNPFQPRQAFDEESLEELATSIREHGFYGHLLVRKTGRWYQLAYGERRFRAAQLADLTAVPVQVRELTDEQMLEISLTENIQREDLHPVDEAHAYDRLQTDLGYSVREIAAKIGKGKSYVATLLSILRYPDVEQAVRSADIPVRTAEELAKIDDIEERRRLINQVIAGNLDRDGVIAARKRTTRAATTVRSADSNQHAIPAFARAFRTLDRQSAAQVPVEERQEAVTLLKQIIERATALLEEMED
jgi:ParB/RepB/Spo0J family partition protein